MHPTFSFRSDPLSAPTCHVDDLLATGARSVLEGILAEVRQRLELRFQFLREGCYAVYLGARLLRWHGCVGEAPAAEYVANLLAGAFCRSPSRLIAVLRNIGGGGGATQASRRG